MASPQELPDVKDPHEAPELDGQLATMPNYEEGAVSPDTAANDAAPPSSNSGDPVVSEQLPSEESTGVTPNNGAVVCKLQAADAVPVAVTSVVPATQFEELPTQELPVTIERTDAANTTSIGTLPPTVDTAPPELPARAPQLERELQHESKVSIHDAVTPPRKRRRDVTQVEDVAILRAIASIKPMDAEWGHGKFRWQQVADVVKKETGDEITPTLCRSRYQHLVEWFNPNRPKTFGNPLNEELYTLTAAAVEDKKQRELDANITRADLRTAFELMTRDDAPHSYEDFYTAVLMASRNGSTQSATTEETQESGDHKEGFGLSIETPKRSREVLAGTMTPRYATPAKRRRTEPRGVSETEFWELKRVVQMMASKLEALEALQRDVEEVKAAHARRLGADEERRAEILDLKTQTADAVAVKDELLGLRALVEGQQVQMELLKNEINSLKTEYGGQLEQVAANGEAQGNQVVQLLSSVEAEQERGRKLEARIDEVQQDVVSRDQDRTLVMDTKVALLEEKVAAFEVIANKQQELIALCEKPLVLSASRRSTETISEIASLRATMEAERAERMSGHAQLLDLLHQMFAKEDRRRV